MSKLVYSSIMSLDGYTADKNGDIRWGMPDDELSAVINDLERPIGTYLYGRRMYETMVYWETFEADDNDSPAIGEFGEIWRAAHKVVYSTTLADVTSARTRLERRLDPQVVARMKGAVGHDMSVAGPDLARQMMAASLLDEIHLYVTPVVLGGGNPALSSEFDSRLELLSVDRFASGVVHLHYRTGS
jgi:dihydrofolate reductase